LLFLIGAGTAAISLLLPHPDEGVVVIWALIGLATLVGSALYVAGASVPTGALHAAVAIASLLINLAVLASGAAAGIYSLIFFWIAIYAAYYFEPKLVAAHLCWMLGGYAVALSLVERTADYSLMTRWLIAAITLSVAATMTSRLAVTRGELAFEARADPLTGIPNRRWLHAELDREIARAERQGFHLSSAFLDLDHFKRFNDTHGHAGGDTLLIDAVEAWRRALRPSDFLARFGGDEFVVLLPDTAVDSATQVIERLRDATPSGATASAGVAEWIPGEPAAELLKRADRCLYEAKAAGRRRVVSAGSSAIPSHA
jgi:diguanylate cyclase (GGDEF)-like protein